MYSPTYASTHSIDSLLIPKRLRKVFPNASYKAFTVERTHAEGPPSLRVRTLENLRRFRKVLRKVLRIILRRLCERLNERPTYRQQNIQNMQDIQKLQHLQKLQNMNYGNYTYCKIKIRFLKCSMGFSNFYNIF